ncbi:hypothetical protein K491DRAFT_717748 [Lophiostoma macrostomum CBS 122681]|uniref:Uncharacterized protein n=1 Tax=Lophiostoma macrostomum CBS 122681 TaxID=1314788 RepID=A0A6A6T274_9PLEO|nr:hypothetical protein K491DRAFT_717748 [Lophiostoma macrostomum CBS 122681]
MSVFPANVHLVFSTVTLLGALCTVSFVDADPVPFNGFDDPFANIPGYELTNIEIHDNEDVFYIDQGDDEGDLVDETNPSVANSSVSWNATLGLRHRSILLEKRATQKKDTVCKDTVGAESASGISIRSYEYPTINEVETEYKNVYDFEDPMSPNEESWYNFKNVNKMSTGTDEAGNKRSYASEHILEWFLLKEFLEEDKTTKGSASRCNVIQQYFKQKVEFQTEIIVAPPGQTSTTKTIAVKEKKAIDWIAHQIPGKLNDDRWKYEFVVLQSHINGKKNELWTKSQDTMSPQLARAQGEVSQKNMANNLTMEWQVVNKYFPEAATQTQKYTQNEGYLMAIKRFRDIIGVYKYHQEDLIKKYWKTQVLRVADAFEKLEKDVLPTLEGGSEYVYQNFRQQWLDFMGDHFTRGKTKIEAWMDKFAPAIKTLSEGGRPEKNPGIDSRSLLFSLFKRAGEETELCAVSTSDEVTERAKLLYKAYENKGEWNNPLEETADLAGS